MVNVKQLKKYCSGDITKIENYEEAINDPNVKYECHHRLEEQGYSAQKLIKMNRYYKVPPEDLILLTPEAHRRLHHVGKEITDEQKKKVSETLTGRKPTDETKRKMSESHKGKKFTEEHNRNMSKAKLGEKNPMYGKKLTDERKRNISKAKLGREITICCKELNKTFYSYAECNREMAKYLGLKQFNVGYIIRHQNGYSRKYNLHFYEL